MTDNITPFPNGSKQPNLPPMTTAERKLWAASHNLPENMLLVTTDEMNAMNDAFQAGLREVRLWRKLGRIYMGADLPEGFEIHARDLIKQRDSLLKRVKELEAERPPTPN